MRFLMLIDCLFVSFLTQVFVLLESIYGAFDKIAERRGVFKVETVGDR